MEERKKESEREESTEGDPGGVELGNWTVRPSRIVHGTTQHNTSSRNVVLAPCTGTEEAPPASIAFSRARAACLCSPPPLLPRRELFPQETPRVM